MSADETMRNGRASLESQRRPSTFNSEAEGTRETIDQGALRARERVPSYYDDLDLSQAHAWSLIERGVKDRRHSFHTPMIAFRRVDGTAGLCTVVLRGFDLGAREIRFHTDLRSRKMQQLRDEPGLAIAFYDAHEKVQLRLDCEVTVHIDDDIADKAWSESALSSRRCYAQPEMPASTLTDPRTVNPKQDVAADDGRENFAAITGRILRMEWLLLSAHGHRRAVFDWTADDYRAAWMAP